MGRISLACPTADESISIRWAFFGDYRAKSTLHDYLFSQKAQGLLPSGHTGQDMQRAGLRPEVLGQAELSAFFVHCLKETHFVAPAVVQLPEQGSQLWEIYEEASGVYKSTGQER